MHGSGRRGNASRGGANLISLSLHTSPPLSPYPSPRLNTTPPGKRQMHQSCRCPSSSQTGGGRARRMLARSPTAACLLACRCHAENIRLEKQACLARLGLLPAQCPMPTDTHHTTHTLQHECKCFLLLPKPAAHWGPYSQRHNLNFRATQKTYAPTTRYNTSYF